MEIKIWDIILGLLAIISFVWAFISEENRTLGIVLGFMLMIIIVVSTEKTRISDAELELKRLGEKLKIH